MKKKYRYFVSYMFAGDNGISYKNSYIGQNARMNRETIDSMCELIKKAENCDKVVILNIFEV